MSKLTKQTTGEAESLEQWAILVLPWLPPSALSAAASTCRSLSRVAATVNSRRVADAARGLEIYPIPFHNPTSDPTPYSYFLYSRFPFSSPPPFCQSWGGNLSRPATNPFSLANFISSVTTVSFFSGCDCVGCSIDGGCPCSGFDDGGGIGVGSLRECGVHCSCGLECVNRTTQRGIGVRVKIVRDLKKGWGLHADQVLNKGEFICEYAGEFVTTEEARRRLQTYDELASTNKLSPALLVVREHLPSGKACLRVNIDATKIGNVARFINHSCDGGNLMVVLVRNSGSFLPRLCFFAALDISEGEELTFSYGDTHLRPNGLPCFCGKEACMGVLPSEET
ncbi:histone-lysine N-methyltransferase SUVR3 [Dendrobium catenatum]|uniref:histone-lysine N-methyltransferase SUVR3 n=1 Tax=Dendrobium catenatum TaxID=906689 RepID=UPI0009F4C3E6|nr:histone-lysine N-methyltransferase SUVR3 [Dendrobium catenatum]